MRLKKMAVLVLMVALIFSSVQSTLAYSENTKVEKVNKEEFYEMLGFTKKDIKDIRNNLKKQNKELKFKNEDIIRFIELGFSREEINDFTEEDIKSVEDLYGELLEVDEQYYLVSEEGSQLVDEEQALEDIEKYKENKAKNEKANMSDSNLITISSTTQIGSDVEQLSWMKMTTTVSKVYDPKTQRTEYLLKNSFQWLTTPAFTLTDAIAISHPESMIQVQGSEHFTYRYDRYQNMFGGKFVSTGSRTKSSADTKNSNGMGFKYDIIGSETVNGTKYLVINNRGWMHFRVTQSNKNITHGNAYGHYTHTRGTLTGSIGVKVSLSGLSLSGATLTTKMRDTGVTFRF